MLGTELGSGGTNVDGTTRMKLMIYLGRGTVKNGKINVF
jgi:hypothetical protein